MAINEYNSDLDIKGKLLASIVPNSTGSIVTWNASTNVFGLRTNAQIISDLNLSSSFIPYTGATANVNLGARSITSTGGFIGNASTATKLASITTTFTGSYPVTVNVNGVIYSHTGLTYTGSTGALTATTFIGALNGNASTATKLVTARTINGTSFNGSANITTANWGTARNITIGNTTKSVNGSANVSWSLAEIGITNQNLSLGSGAGQIDISNGTGVILDSLSRVNLPDFNDVSGIKTGGFTPFVNTTGSLGYPYAIGQGVMSLRSSSTQGSFALWTNNSDTNLYLNVGSSTGWTGWETVATREWVDGKFALSSWGRGLRVDGNGIIIHNMTSGDTNSIRNASMYTSGINKPSVGNGSVVNFTPYSSSGNHYGFDLYMAAASDRFFIRRETAAVKQSWIEVIHEGNLDTQATSLGFIKSSSLSGYVPTSRTITAGNGLSGGGSLAANRTITLGTPSAITLSSTNSVTTSSHTHEFKPGGTTAQYIRGDGSLATYVNTTYTAGTGLSLTGTVFGQTITTSGTGTFVTGITQTANGFQINLGTPPNTNTTYSAGNGLTLSGTTFSVNYGTTAGTSAQGNDSRINNGQTAFGWGDYRQWGLGSYSHNQGWAYTSLDDLAIGDFKETSFIATGTRNPVGNKAGFTYPFGIHINVSTAVRGDIIMSHGANRLAFRGAGRVFTEVITEDNLDSQATTLGFIKSSSLSGYVPTSRTLTAGNGLSGGGNLTANRTFTLGTPSAIGISTTNAVTSTSHTHALDSATTTAINNGNTAFGWGNHALVGYATETWVKSFGIGKSITEYNNISTIERGIPGGLYSTNTSTTGSPISSASGSLISIGSGVYGGTNSFIWVTGNNANEPRAFFTHASTTGEMKPWEEIASQSWVNSLLTGFVPTSRTITAGNGLSGGGSLAANRTITLGTPSAITLSSTNSVTTSSHTHEFKPGGTTAQYIRGDGSLATYVNTTYTAGTGLSLTGTVFGQTITTSGTGTFVTGITQTANGFQINLGTPPNTNTTYSAGNGLTLSGTTFSLPVVTSGSGNVVSAVAQSTNGITVTKGNSVPLQASTGGDTNSIRVLDTRSTNPAPSTNLKNGTWFDFKTTSAIGLTISGVSTYASVMTMVPYTDVSGNNNTAFRLAQSNNGLYFQQALTSKTGGWDNWKSVVDGGISNIVGGDNPFGEVNWRMQINSSNQATLTDVFVHRNSSFTIGSNSNNFEAINLKTVFGSLNFDDEGLIYRPNSHYHSFSIESNVNAHYNIELHGKLNSLKINGRGSLGSPLDLLNGTKLSNYVFGDVSSKDALGTFRVESNVIKGGIPVFGRYGASILAQTGDTMFTLSANPNASEFFVSAGNTTNNVLWNKKLAFSVNEFTITATAFYESSLKKFKTNIKPFNKSGIELINSLDIVTFDRIDDKTKNKIGIIADDTSEEFLSENKDAVDLYKTIFIQAKAIQELDKNNKTLEERINQLERIIKEFL